MNFTSFTGAKPSPFVSTSVEHMLIAVLFPRRFPSMLSYLSSLPISVLRSLDTEANKVYDRSNRLYDAALLTRCYTQHALRPVFAQN